MAKKVMLLTAGVAMAMSISKPQSIGRKRRSREMGFDGCIPKPAQRAVGKYIVISTVCRSPYSYQHQRDLYCVPAAGATSSDTKSLC